MSNIAETVKKQTDRILRQRALNGSEGVVVRGVSSGTGAPAPTVNNPPVDLTAHKTSGDHDGRYYTESEIDGKLNFLTLTDTPAAYTGEGGKIVAVKADVSGLEFVAAPAAANGIPEGGTAGQVLEKIDGTDYNTQWADPAGGASPLTTKGDVFVYGSADARLPVGTDDQVLTADSAQALGVKWATPSTGGTVPACRVYHNTNQSINDSTWTALVLNAERFDTDTMHDTSTNNSRITINTAGVYQITGNVEFAAKSTNVRLLAIYVNSIATGTRIALVTALGSSAPTRMGISTLYSLDQNDYVELCVYQNSGGALNITYAPAASPEFTAVKVG